MKNININTTITDENINRALRVLEDNGIDTDETEIVLQAIGYALLDTELIEEDEEIEEENDDDMYNNSPEYIHDAAVDWMNEHADFLNDIGQDNFIKRCAEELAEEGYNTEEYYWAVEEAFDDMDWDCPEYDD